MSRRALARALAVAVVLIAAPAAAHEVLYEVATGAAVVVQLHYADGRPFAYESYELYAGDAEQPAQLGRSDAAGRVVFLPGDVRQWRLKAYSEDGHGLDVQFATGAERAAIPTPAAGGSHAQWTITGVAVLFGLFGVAQLFLRRRPRP